MPCTPQELLSLLALGIEADRGGGSVVVHNVPAAVVYRHRTINSAGKVLVCYVHTPSVSQLQTSGTVSFQKCW